MAAAIPDQNNVRAFATEQAFETWLKANHDKASELFVRIYKKDSGVPTISYAQALDVALCWGWIDGLKRSYDPLSFLQRFSPRRTKSLWSKNNREHVARLIADKRMTAHGLRHVTAAKADGRWDAAYDGSAKMAVPDDLLAALKTQAKARKLFESLDQVNRYALLWRIQTRKTPAGRAKMIVDAVAMLKRGETVHPRKPKASKRKAR